MSKKVLIVATHTDDEALGCSGTIAKHIANGDSIHLLFMTNGVDSRSESEDVDSRLTAAKDAAKILKVSSLTNLDFPDNTFDQVITTLIWCSVPDPVKGFKEARRVLKLGGEAIFLEHVLSSNKLIAALEHFHNPVTKFLLGCNINRKTRDNIEKAGFKVMEDRKLYLKDVFRLFKVKK